MRRLKKSIYLRLCGTAVLVLAIVRVCNPEVMRDKDDVSKGRSAISLSSAKKCQRVNISTFHQGESYHPIRGVHSYKECFPDAQDVQIVAARRWGVSPVRNRIQAENRKDELVYVGSSPYYAIDKGMRSSIPYLVPRAADLLQTIGRNYLDSLAVKGIPLHRIIVTSVLRTEEDVARLRRHNPNATEQSCHQFGTTFDIAQNRYHTVSPPGEHRRAVTNDTLKYVLCEVLRDLRKQERCYIKYEVKQACFHITTR